MNQRSSDSQTLALTHSATIGLNIQPGTLLCPLGQCSPNWCQHQVLLIARLHSGLWVMVLTTIHPSFRTQRNHKGAVQIPTLLQIIFALIYYTTVISLYSEGGAYSEEHHYPEARVYDNMIIEINRDNPRAPSTV